jgi:hypothetical protein
MSQFHSSRRLFSLIALALVLLAGLLPAAAQAQAPAGRAAGAPDLTNNLDFCILKTDTSSRPLRRLPSGLSNSGQQPIYLT